MLNDQTVAAALSSKIFNLIILPTEKCNFRCTYCYEDFEFGRMSGSVATAIKRLISRRISGLSSLSISWFGGEPLLAKDIVQDIGSFSHKICEERGVRFRASFTTNGYLLTPDLFSYFLDISHREYQITLDGDEEWHDRTRVQANRKATFSKIWSNLISYKNISGNFSIMLRLHVHRDNIESQKRLYARLQSEILDDKRFYTYFHKVSNLSPDRKIDEGVLDRKSYLDAIEYITNSAAGANAKKPKSEEHLDGYICYAAKPNSLMIRANGDIGKCTVALNDDRNRIGRINGDGTLELSNAKLQRWFHGYSDMSEQALGCPLSTLSNH